MREDSLTEHPDRASQYSEGRSVVKGRGEEQGWERERRLRVELGPDLEKDLREKKSEKERAAGQLEDGRDEGGEGETRRTVYSSGVILS